VTAQELEWIANDLHTLVGVGFLIVALLILNLFGLALIHDRMYRRDKGLT
jgi:hypothetical protein